MIIVGGFWNLGAIMYLIFSPGKSILSLYSQKLIRYQVLVILHLRYHPMEKNIGGFIMLHEQKAFAGKGRFTHNRLVGEQRGLLILESQLVRVKGFLFLQERICKRRYL